PRWPTDPGCRFAPSRLPKIDPATLGHAAVAGFGKGDIANAGAEVRCHRGLRHHMAQEPFPTDPVRIAVSVERRRLGPIGAISAPMSSITLKCAMLGVARAD